MSNFFLDKRVRCGCHRIAGSDIKDKTVLMEARKNIEKEMERFKHCEKEAKTKAFSKAGLGQAAKLDPEEKARQVAREWLNEQVEALQMQVVLTAPLCACVWRSGAVD